MFFYDFLGNYGLAIIVLAIILKLIMLPFQMKSKRGMLRQTRLQPKIAELNKIFVIDFKDVIMEK
jgi:YidC/Oxa1 family membrane protein insertase